MSNDRVLAAAKTFREAQEQVDAATTALGAAETAKEAAEEAYHQANRRYIEAKQALIEASGGRPDPWTRRGKEWLNAGAPVGPESQGVNTDA